MKDVELTGKVENDNDLYGMSFSLSCRCVVTEMKKRF